MKRKSVRDSIGRASYVPCSIGDPIVRQATQGVGHECHESIDDTNYDGDLATYMRK
jgi:hypothetical protein